MKSTQSIPMSALDRRLWLAAGRNMGTASAWLTRANEYCGNGGTLNEFVAHATRSHRRIAKAAFDVALACRKVASQRDPAKATGRKYGSVAELMRGEGVSQKVQDMVKQLEEQ